MKLSEVAERLSVRVERDGEFTALGDLSVSKPGQLVYLESERYLPALLENSGVSCVMASPALLDRLPEGVGVACADEPRRAYFELHNYLAAETDFYGWVDFPTEISPEARVSPAAYVAERNVRIGPGVVIEPNATVLDKCIIEAGVILRAGCVIGGQGFEFKRLGDEILPVAHAGGVRLGARVEVQAKSTVDRAIFGGFTELGADTKLDDHVHVAHNVRIGRRCLLAASATISGSVVMEDDVWVGPGATISNQIVVGAGASVSLGSVVTKNVPPGARVTGNFAIPHATFLAALKRALREH